MFSASLIALALTGCAASPAPLATAPAAPPPTAPPSAATPPAPPAQPAPLADLVSRVDIPYQKFVLANGLTVLVHTDRKAPIVGVTLYYRVGSKNEPKGKTGFAHLYEHLFFGGSENVPNFDIPLEGAGSTSTNGSTSYDRTNYVETVPTGALPLALFMESDRMGHLLGAVTQDKLNKQRGVVQNEKRQGDNQPYGLADYALGEGLYPVGHPYRHTPIGSMADLDAASLADVRQWFKDNYGPNNVVLALAGDIDAAAARPLVEKWFGDIPRGAQVPPVTAGPVTLAAPMRREMTDQVPTTRIYRTWSAPGLNDPEMPALVVGMDILGGLASSRFDNALVKGAQVATMATAMAQPMEQVSQLMAAMDVKDGVDRAAAEKAFDSEIARLLSEGPSEDEVRRAATRQASYQIGALEQVGGFSGKGATLAEGELYSHDPEKYRADLAAIAALTPAEVKAALQKWLGRPSFTLTVLPGQRTEKGELMGGWGDETAAKGKPVAKPAAKAAPAPKLVKSAPRAAPPVEPVGALAFPAVERSVLSNGIPVTLARRSAVPKVLVNLNFDAGTSADLSDAPGTQATMLALLDEGTASRSAIQIAEEQERLGATINAGASQDSSAIALDALAANLAPSLALMADLTLHPAFAAEDVARVKAQRLAELAQAEATPMQKAQRTMAPLLFGPAHPYGLPADGLGTEAALSALTPEALLAAHDKWLRPDLARITVVGDITMAELKPLLEQAFGNWAPPAAPKPAKPMAAPVPAAQARIVVVDRPGSPQSAILMGRILPLTGTVPDKEALDLANEVLGSGFLSRLNMDLREDKGWTYGVRSSIDRNVGPRTFTVATPVQSDRTGDAIKLLLADMKAFPASRPVEPVEVSRVTDGNVRGLPNRYETNGQVMGQVVINDRLGRPDDYVQTLPARYRAVDAKSLDTAARTYLGPDGLTIVVVGDRKLIEPQLKSVGLPVSYLEDSAKGP
ncbi:M16 family metallopeptidase [Novosphingobium flavum]|uniref:M16 family metallopeptidase n=1 Tax=Novosphingobium flavum TaxID=1778672 RepID=UPI001FE2D5DA|nr:pitrilysin family protein [Novosphingobium flavum]